MVEVVRHEPGAFSWAELATTDPEAAKRFYTSLFGWTFVDNPMGSDMVYTRLQLNGRDAAAMYAQMKDQREQGSAETGWCTSPSQRGRDGEAREELGGAVLQEPFGRRELRPHGRVQGSARAPGFSVWQPGTHIGVQVANEPGALSWCELASRDTTRPAASTRSSSAGSQDARRLPYVELMPGRQAIGGIFPMTIRCRASRRTGACTSASPTATRPWRGRSPRRARPLRPEGHPERRPLRDAPGSAGGDVLGDPAERLSLSSIGVSSRTTAAR
jgi:predicted enzyme related to lactoylglutathione lyase